MTIQRERARTGKILRQDYTDLAVVIGPDVRWVEDDYEDLCQFAPEVLLGYRVLLTTTEAVKRGYLRGREVSKAVVLSAPRQSGELRRVVSELWTRTSRVECYRVHRALEPVVQRVW